MVRKYAFHMILAGHRFNKAGQVSGRCVCVCLRLWLHHSVCKHTCVGEGVVFVVIVV